jgi:hypothetical protein
VGHPSHGPALISAAIFTVNSCDDPLPLPSACPDQTTKGSLPLWLPCAHGGGTVDLAQLQCSKITVSAPLTPPPVTLALAGPVSHPLTIDAAVLQALALAEAREQDAYLEGPL